AEGLPVRGARYVVRDGMLHLDPDRPEVAADGTCRVIPHRAYRVHADAPVRVNAASGKQLAYPHPTDFIFNSGENDRVQLVRGEGVKATIEEVGPVNVLRRSGTPFRAEGEDGTLYEEGRDFARVVDPLVEQVRQTGRFSAFHDG